MKAKKNLDDTNRFIISEIMKNGRVTYTELAQKLKVTPAAVKERVERLIENKIIKVTALVNTKNFYPLTAGIGIEADSESVGTLVKKLKPCPLVFHMTKTSGIHNLVMSIVAEDITQLDDFLNKQIRTEPGIRHIEVNIGNETVVPEYNQFRVPYPLNPEFVPCGLRQDDKKVCVNCPGRYRKEI